MNPLESRARDESLETLATSECFAFHWAHPRWDDTVHGVSMDGEWRSSAVLEEKPRG